MMQLGAVSISSNTVVASTGGGIQTSLMTSNVHRFTMMISANILTLFHSHSLHNQYFSYGCIDYRIQQQSIRRNDQRRVKRRWIRRTACSHLAVCIVGYWATKS
jgi:hypothetical protein